MREAARPSDIPTLKLNPPLSFRDGVDEVDSWPWRAAEAVTEVEARAEDEENNMARDTIGRWYEAVCAGREVGRRVKRQSTRR